MRNGIYKWVINGPVDFARSFRRFLNDKIYRKNSKLIFFHSYRHHIQNQLRYSDVAHPLRSITIDPTEVRRYDSLMYHYGLGRISGGDWDRDGRQIGDHPTIQGLKDRFVDGRAWEDTAYVRGRMDRFERGELVYGCRTVQEFIDRQCSYVDELFEKIKTDGFIPYSDRCEEAHGLKGPDPSPHQLDPLISIGRTGELLLNGSGRHRFTIAQILDRPLPVQVVCRHQEWQQIRDKTATKGTVSDELEGHPDLLSI